jgi:cobalt-zinc-cadmium efflux system protein
MSAHDHAHDHSHAHGHHHEVPENFDRAFLIGIGLNLTIVVGQVIFGFLAHSLALLADAAHNFSDVIGLVLAFAGAILARRLPSARYTYGLRKASVLAALANAALLLLATGGIIVEAIQRFFEPAPVANGTVVWVAAIGMVLNGVTALLFLRGRHDDLNLRGAFLHMSADALVSLGVVIAALVIMATGWLWIDPAMGLVIAAVILWSSWGLTRDTTKLALDAVPEGVDHSAVETFLRGLPGTTDVHDLHIWGMSTRDVALTVHLVRPGEGLDDHFLTELNHDLQHRFGISHATVQIEAGDPAHPCALAPANVV